MKRQGVQVLFFARGRELVGLSECHLELKDAQDTAQLKEHLLSRFPKLAEIMDSTVLSLNQEYLGPHEAVSLKDGDEVAIIPPVSGG